MRQANKSVATDSGLKSSAEPLPDAGQGACGLCFTDPRSSTRRGGVRITCIGFSSLFLSRQLLAVLAALASTSQEHDGVEAWRWP